MHTHACMRAPHSHRHLPPPQVTASAIEFYLGTLSRTLTLTIIFTIIFILIRTLTLTLT